MSAGKSWFVSVACGESGAEISDSDADVGDVGDAFSALFVASFADRVLTRGGVSRFSETGDAVSEDVGVSSDGTMTSEDEGALVSSRTRSRSASRSDAEGVSAVSAACSARRSVVSVTTSMTTPSTITGNGDIGRSAGASTRGGVAGGVAAPGTAEAAEAVEAAFSARRASRALRARVMNPISVDGDVGVVVPDPESPESEASFRELELRSFGGAEEEGGGDEAEAARG